MFNVGDTVQLKSGGPVMTVVSTNDKTCRCTWFKDDEVKESAFPAEALDKYEEPDFAAVY